MYEYSLGSIAAENFEIIAHTNDLYQSELLKKHLAIDGTAIETYYERMFKEKGFKINYIEAILK